MEDEQWLVQRAKENSAQFSTLYFRYIDRIYAYVQRETGDTAVTDAEWPDYAPRVYLMRQTEPLAEPTIVREDFEASTILLSFLP